MSTDNLEEAMALVMDTLPLTITQSSGARRGAGTVQVIVRASEESRTRWKETASLLGISVAQLARNLLDAEAAKILDCTHPKTAQRHNRWGAICTICGQQHKRRR